MAVIKTDIQEVKRSMMLLKADSELVEIRAYDNRKIITSGYFKYDYSNLYKGLEKLTYDNCYFTLNNIKEGCYDRSQHETYEKYVKITTNDDDIISRQWLLVDADPIRPSGTSSTDEEKEHSRYLLGKVYNYLCDIGFAYPIVADSGNGYHLLYRIALANVPEVTAVIKTFLQSLDVMFSDDVVSIDTSVFNPSRIVKLYGTAAKKGANTEKRPHRISRIIKIPEEIKVTNIELIKKVADMLPKPDAPDQKPNYLNTEFNIHDFMNRHLRVAQVINSGNYTKYRLEVCPFNESHKSPDSMITVSAKGAIGFHCLHHSCSDKNWHDVRNLFEPKQGKSHDTTRTNKPVAEPAKIPEPPKSQLKQYLQLHEIESVDRSNIVSIPTGIKILDRKMVGLNKKEVTVVSGNNGSAKSTIIGQLMLCNVEKGFKCTLFSGELTQSRIKTWLHLQAAGRQFNKLSQYGENVYYTPKDVGEAIDAWTKGKLFIHNNLAGTKFSDILKTIEETVKKEHTDIVYIDNLMAMDLSEVNGDKYERQTSVILKLTEISKTYDIHIVFICHPKKADGFLRKGDISGTADLTNAVDNVIICHRVNIDFERHAKEFFGEPKINAFLKNKYTNCIEIVKNRDLGVEDLIGLYFEVESKRLLNEPHENIVFGWKKPRSPYSDNNIVMTEITDEEEFPWS